MRLPLNFQYVLLFLFSIFVSPLFLSACSTYNTLGDKSAYHKYVNEKTGNKEIRVTTNEDEDLMAKDFVIKNDSASWVSLLKLKTSVDIAFIRNIRFKDGYNNKAVIELNNEEFVKASGIEEHDDIVTFYEEKEIPYTTAIGNIRKVSIKNHYLGAVGGFGLGLAAGSSAGLLFHIVDEKGFKYPALMEGAFVGCIAGLITGAIIGVWNNYYFR